MKDRNMGDIIKSGILGMVLLGILVFAAPILNRKDSDAVPVKTKHTEVTKEQDIHIPF